MGFRGSRVQIPPSRLSEDQALQRFPLWGFFFALPRAVNCWRRLHFPRWNDVRPYICLAGKTQRMMMRSRLDASQIWWHAFSAHRNATLSGSCSSTLRMLQAIPLS